MVHIGLRTLPLRKKRQQAQKKGAGPKVMTISLVNPPLFYRKSAIQKQKYLHKMFYF